MTDSSRTAVLEANYSNLQRQAVDHEKRDEDRFDRTFAFIKNRSDEILERVGELDDKFTEKFADLEKKVDNLWDERSERRGAIKLSNLAGHLATGMVSVAVALGIKKLW